MIFHVFHEDTMLQVAHKAYIVIDNHNLHL